MYESLGNEPKQWWRERKTLVAIGALFFLIILMIIVAVIVVQTEKRHNGTDESLPHLPDMMQTERIVSHLRQLEAIANKNNGTRTAKTGYNDSISYVAKMIEENTNYNYFIQEFQFEFYQEVIQPQLFQTVPTPSPFVYGTQFRGMRYCGSGNVTGPLYYVNGGCEESDYTNFPANSIALIDRNELFDCQIVDKVTLAINKGAIGVIISSDDNTLFTRGLPKLINIPAFSITNDLAMDLQELLNDGVAVSFRMVAETTAPLVGTMNLIAETLTGDPNNVIVVGSHLDSVPAGPGINDNGSGSAANLELAIQLYNSKLEIKNRVRFAWWAGEEFGLLGSTFYVKDLNSTEEGRKALSQIALNLNFDMLGSPNYFRGVYNGSGAAEDIRYASTQIQELFVEFFEEKNLAFDLTPFTGRSDYGPFIEHGIPAGGLATGAEQIKDAKGREKYGGFANAPYDPCYHLYCDTLDNVNQKVLLEMSQAAAWTLEKLSTQENLKDWLSEN